MLHPDSIYDDSPEEHYQFPKMYLSRAREAAGDWIVYLEPTKVRNSRGYFAIARVQEIIPDPKAENMFLAVIKPGSYLDFAHPVPFSDKNGPIERGLLNEQGKLSGRAQSAARPISPNDFLRIVEKGLKDSEQVSTHHDTTEVAPDLAENRAIYTPETERDRLKYMTSRIVRDRAFRQLVLRAYDARCAITGLKIINGGGWAVVEAAHIRPVDQNGPDIINNGIALSGTAHKMFDRGLISISDDFEILISRQVNDVDSLKAFVNEDGRALVPSRPADQPHPRFLSWHREYRFKS